MNARSKAKLREDRGIDIDHVPHRVSGHDMPAAATAELAVAAIGLVIGADLVGTFCHLHRGGLPQGEGIDGGRRPGPAGFAMAIAHRLGRTGGAYFHRPAKASSRESCSLHVRLLA